MKKVFAVLMAMAMVFSLAACGGSSARESAQAATGAEAGDQSLAGKKVGVAMPTQSSERWINDGNNMKALLEAKGAEVVLQYGDDNIQQQVSQIEGMIAQQVDCLVIAAIDSGSLTTVEQSAADAGIPIIAYDRLLMDTPNVDYYATFDNKGVGMAIAQYVEQKLDLANAKANGKPTPVSCSWALPMTTTPCSSTTVLWMS